MHDYHESLKGFSEAQILHDDCGECEARSRLPAHGLEFLDRGNFYRAWARAAEWNRNGLTDLSRTEIPLLNMLWMLQVKLESYAHIPIGQVPIGLPT